MWKGVGLSVVAQVEGFFESHQIHGVASERNEEYFHQEQVERFPPGEQIDVAEEEDC